MRKSRFTAEQIAHALRQAETGTPVTEVCRAKRKNIIRVLREQEADVKTEEVCRRHWILDRDFLQVEIEVWRAGGLGRQGLNPALEPAGNLVRLPHYSTIRSHDRVSESFESGQSSGEIRAEALKIGQHHCEHAARYDSPRRYSAWEEVVVPSEPFSLPQYGLRVGQRFRTHRKPGLFRLVSESAYRSALLFAWKYLDVNC